MLNITFYRGVPLQTDYKNVLGVTRQNFENFLSQYYVNELNGLAVRFDNTNSIVLTKYYENCNYMRIEDTNAVQQIKYYFISNCEFVSTNVKYNIVCDIWHTYNYNITNFYKSLMIEGHADVLNGVSGIFKLNSLYIPRRDFAYANYLIEPEDMNLTTFYDTISLIATVAISANNNTTSSTLIITQRFTTKVAMAKFLKNLFENTARVVGESSFEYEILNLYIIPQFDSYNLMDSNLHMTSLQVGSDNIACYGYFFYSERTVGETTQIFDNPVLFSYTIFSKNKFKDTYNSTTIANKMRKANTKFRIGTYNNYKELDTIFDLANSNMSIELNIIEMQKIQLLLKFDTNNVIDITDSFELPIVNDSYNLYMNRNENQIRTQNITNFTTLLTSLGAIGAGALLAPVTAGVSVAGGVAGAIGATSSFISKEIQSNAKLKDAKNTIDKVDNTLSNVALMLNYGVGVFEFYYDDTFVSETYNKFGTSNNTYIIDFKPQDLTPYNYYYLQLQHANFSGEFNENIKSILKSIFENGVRIWCDYTNYLNNVNYKKQ